MEVVAGWRARRQIQQTKTRQRCDALASFDEPGQRQTQLEERRVVRANAAHGEESDFHGAPPRMVNTTASISATTGMKNRCRHDSRQPVRKHTAGMATPPMMKPSDAPEAHDAAAKRVVAAQEIVAMEEQAEARARDECKKEQPPAELPIEDMGRSRHSAPPSIRYEGSAVDGYTWRTTGYRLTASSRCRISVS